MLTGKISRGERPPDTRLGQRDVEFYKDYFTERSHGVVDVLRSCARELGSTPAQLAIAWQLAKPEVSAVILGARTLAQLDDTLGAVGVTVPDAVMARLDEASALEPEYPGAFLDMIQRWLGNQ
jgi:aryl-alcohol dehydrogenase-like predicted oxidoreductase